MSNNGINPKITPQMRAELDAVAAMRDEDIDLSDIPEKLDWSNAVRGKFYRPVKQQVTLRIDSDLIHWFKTNGGNARGYQTRINAALRRFVEQDTKPA